MVSPRQNKTKKKHKAKKNTKQKTTNHYSFYGCRMLLQT